MKDHDDADALPHGNDHRITPRGPRSPALKMPIRQPLPYSLEKLVESDPDIIFVVTMGNAAEIETTMRDDVESNPAWSTLRAVRDKKLMFLGQRVFHYGL